MVLSLLIITQLVSGETRIKPGSLTPQLEFLNAAPREPVLGLRRHIVGDPAAPTALGLAH